MSLLVMQDCRFKVSKIAKNIGISDEMKYGFKDVEAFCKASATHIDIGSKLLENENLSSLVGFNSNKTDFV